MNEAVRFTPELERILALPRRSADGAELVEPLTELLSVTDRCPGKPSGPYSLCDVCGAPMRLRPAQALALHDIGTLVGAFCPLDVGQGKTLITLLAPYVLDAQRPLLLLPANLVQKTNREREVLARHWLIPANIRLLSYEMLGRVQAAHELELYRPDLVLADEVHRLKNRRAAVTRRVSRFIHDHPETRFIGMSGTIMRKSLLDFGHIVRWSLKDGAPIPKTDVELEEWAAALDERAPGGSDLRRFEPGALLHFCTPEEIAKPANDVTPVIAARRGFQRRLVETPGVVATLGNAERVSCSIYVRAITYNVAPVTERHFAKLRREWLTPDDWPPSQAVDIWRHARELALGLHYVWDPRPPEAWRNARRAWSAFVREVLGRSRTLDSELQVAQACDAGKLDNTTLEAWRAIKDSFTPNTVPVWHDDSALAVCLDWMRKPGIVWTEHAFFAERLATMSGCPYFGAKGLAADGSFIDDADSRRSAIVSVDANREGRNLQTKWHRNLVVSPPEGADIWQQMIGRTHRTGQSADEVTVDVLLGCAEHANAWRKAIASAKAIRDTTGAEQKLLLADVEWPTDDEIERFFGARWG